VIVIFCREWQLITKIVIIGLIYGIVWVSILSGQFVTQFCKGSLFAVRAAWKVGFVKYGSSANENSPICDVIEAIVGL